MFSVAIVSCQIYFPYETVHVIPPLVINTTTHNNKSMTIGETKHLYNQLPVTKWMSVNSESVNKHYYIIMPLFLTFRKTIMMIYVEVTFGNKSHVYKNQSVSINALPPPR